MTPRAGPPPTALTIAGSDSGGGAGLQADLRAFQACGVHGMTAVTAVTVQNSLGVSDFVALEPEFVAAQIHAVAGDIGVGAAKTGMLANTGIITAVAAACDAAGIGRSYASPFVVDPVAASMHGDPLLQKDALDAIRTSLFPRATIVTPNLDEVRLLVDIDARTTEQMADAARALHALGPQWVLVKGGHLTRSPECLDLLYDGEEFREFYATRIDTPHTHGGGDTFASAITARLAGGASIEAAVEFGKRFVTDAVSRAYPLGSGVGPVSTLPL